MQAQAARIGRWNDGSAMPWQVLLSSTDTDGTFLIGEARLEPGAPCPPLHVHAKEHESFYVIEGLFTVELGDERIEVGPGGCVNMPPGVPHRFGNLSDGPVRLVATVSPTAIEAMYAAEEAYFSSLDGPPDPEALEKIIEPYGITVLGPPLTE